MQPFIVQFDVIRCQLTHKVKSIPLLWQRSIRIHDVGEADPAGASRTSAKRWFVVCVVRHENDAIRQTLEDDRYKLRRRRDVSSFLMVMGEDASATLATVIAWLVLTVVDRDEVFPGREIVDRRALTSISLPVQALDVIGRAVVNLLQVGRSGKLGEELVEVEVGPAERLRKLMIEVRTIDDNRCCRHVGRATRRKGQGAGRLWTLPVAAHSTHRRISSRYIGSAIASTS